MGGRYRVAPLIGLAVIIGLNGNTSRAGTDWDADKATITRMFSNRDCASAWELLLKHVKTGNKKSMLAAAGAMFGPGLRLPGTPTDASYTLRLVAAFAMNGYEPSNTAADNELFKMLGSGVLGQFGSECGIEKFDPDRCAHSVKTKRLLPTKDELLNEITSFQSQSSGKAFCVDDYKG